VLEYVHRWQDQRAGLKTTQIDTPTLRVMLEYIDSGEPIIYEGGEDPVGVREQIQLVLDARAWGFL